MAKVVIVSNRLPISVKKENGKLVFSPSLGGLATGLSSYVDDPNSTWIGWPGIASDDLTEQEKELIATELEVYKCRPIYLTKKQIDDFYNGYCNSVIWPMFHNLTYSQNSPDIMHAWWQAYRKVNELFAEAVLNLAEPESQIWVHDYHLLLLPGILRSRHLVTSIGFFLHIPFPDTKTISSLMTSKQLVNGMLGADLVGFHTDNFVTNFMLQCKKMGLETVDENAIALPSRIVGVDSFPMGIDYQKFSNARKSKSVKQAVKRYKKRYHDLKLIVSVERLDPTKGLIERLNAYGEFLRRNPNQRGKVVFAMVAAPSRTDILAYKRLTTRLAGLAEEINRLFGTENWRPIDYMNISQPFEEVAALFQIADIAFITPLRDGMNLTAKEFVASNKKHGVLILSETAGAAEELKGAIIVNPRQQASLVDGLEQAMKMRKREFRGRLNRMKKDLSINTVQNWSKTFIESLRCSSILSPNQTLYLDKPLLQKLYSDYSMAKNRLILLDYDGTLVPFSEDYQDAEPPKSLLRLLEKLSLDRANNTVLISGRSAEDLQKWFSTVNMNLVAEHGAAIKTADSKTWMIIERSNTKWKKNLLPVLEKYTRLTPGAQLEVKTHSLVWHYRSASPYHAQKYAIVLKSTLKPMLKMYGLELLYGNKVIEIKKSGISKANVAERWLNQGYPFVLCIGDDETDEELFSILPASSYGIKVGRGRTMAPFRTDSSREVLALLHKLAK